MSTRQLIKNYLEMNVLRSVEVMCDVALNVAAPHVESVRNCEPVRLLMTQYTLKWEYIYMCVCV